jgi:hypothetical protein
MPIDASIPLHGLLINRNDENLKQQRLAMGQLQMQQVQRDNERQQKLSELLPQAVHGDRSAIDQLAGVDPEMFMKLDDRERAQAQARVADLTAAVRWTGGDPAKWDQVIDHYGQEGIDLSQYRGHPELAEQAMLNLGKLGEYLNAAPKMDVRATEPGGGLYGIGADGSVKVLVQPNDGSAPMGAPVSAPPPPPGFVIDGGPTQSASGGFPY